MGDVKTNMGEVNKGLAAVILPVIAACLLILVAPSIKRVARDMQEYGQRPRVSESKKGRVIEDADCYYGIDFDRNGRLDEVSRIIGGGRTGWATKIYYKQNDFSFQSLQEKYKRVLSSNRR